MAKVLVHWYMDKMPRFLRASPPEEDVSLLLRAAATVNFDRPSDRLMAKDLRFLRGSAFRAAEEVLRMSGPRILVPVHRMAREVYGSSGVF